MNDEDILNFCESKIEKELIAGEQFHGEWDDLPDDRLERLNEVLRLHKRFIFYEFALEAKTKMIEEDERAALLYSVIALEAAHAAYLKLCLADKFQHIDDERERFSKVQKLGNDLLREQGLMTVFQLTPIIFMESADRPTPEEIESCRGAISLRNDIMHALTTKGEYKLRKQTRAEISDAYKAVLAMYAKYAAAVERKVLGEGAMTADDSAFSAEMIARKADKHLFSKCAAADVFWPN